MTSEPRLRVSNPPPKPLMIWDGECHFCRMWIERWRAMTAGKVDYATYQQAASQFPEIPLDQFKHAMALIEPDGKTFFAAEAVYRSLQYRSSRKWLEWSYDHVPGFAAISESAYKFIARHRSLGSSVTWLLWGKDVRPPTYFWARRWFLRALGVIYLIAFVSLWVQVDGLIGSDGVSPANQFLPAVHAQLGKEAYTLLPTLCWFSTSNTFLHFLCGGGSVLSVFLIFGIAPALSLVALFAFYLSLTIAGQTFLSFQWDVLLLETGFLSIFLAPWRLWPKDLLLSPHSFGVPPSGGPSRVNAELRAASTAASPVCRAALFLLKFLLFKLMLMSGVVKLTSGDDCWWNLTALDYHYWSQPLPTVFAWWAD
ncbi:MAG: lipase maturation factor family protein, partial [Candidatus Udaeobacter sp.]